MKENNKNNTGRTLIDMVFERPWIPLLILFSIFGGIFFLGKLGFGFEFPSIIKIIPPEPQNPTAPVTKPEQEDPFPVTPSTTPNAPLKPLVEKREQSEKIIEGFLDFQTRPTSEYYFIKVQGKGDYQRVEKSGEFKIFVDPTETVVHVDVFNQAKEKITSKNIEASTSNIIQIIIK